MNVQGTIERTDQDTVNLTWSDPPRMSDGEIREAQRRLRRDLRKTLREMRHQPAPPDSSWPVFAPTPTIARATRAGRSTTARRVAGFSGTRRTAASGPDADQPGEPGDIGSTPRRPSEEVPA